MWVDSTGIADKSSEGEEEVKDHINGLLMVPIRLGCHNKTLQIGWPQWRTFSSGSWKSKIKVPEDSAPGRARFLPRCPPSCCVFTWRERKATNPIIGSPHLTSCYHDHSPEVPPPTTSKIRARTSTQELWGTLASVHNSGKWNKGIFKEENFSI